MASISDFIVRSLSASCCLRSTLRTLNTYTELCFCSSRLCLQSILARRSWSGSRGLCPKYYSERWQRWLLYAAWSWCWRDTCRVFAVVLVFRRGANWFCWSSGVLPFRRRACWWVKPRQFIEWFSLFNRWGAWSRPFPIRTSATYLNQTIIQLI